MDSKSTNFGGKRLPSSEENLSYDTVVSPDGDLSDSPNNIDWWRQMPFGGWGHAERFIKWQILLFYIRLTFNPTQLGLWTTFDRGYISQQKWVTLSEDVVKFSLFVRKVLFVVSNGLNVWWYLLKVVYSGANITILYFAETA